ncbi:claudin-9-like [Narcine bancroftii]|uniref:claudin-9-like n=1 Tax=Narcine bancroftii TaxID=1343680 RepID=UPI0038321C43
MPPHSAFLQTTGLLLCSLGWAGSLACCVLPFWKATTFSGQNIMTKQRMIEGLWVTCTLPSPGKASCTVYKSSHKELSMDVYAARILCLCCLLSGLLGLVLQCLGSQCTNCVPMPALKSRLLRCSGLLCAFGGLALLVAVSWPGYLLATEFYHPLVSEVLDIKVGPCIYLGLASGASMLLGGCLLGCWCCWRKDERRDRENSVPQFYIQEQKLGLKHDKLEILSKKMEDGL